MKSNSIKDIKSQDDLLQELREVKHLDALEIMILANRSYIRGQLIQMGKVSLIDPIIAEAEKHMRSCIECKKMVKKPSKPIKISKSDWLSLLSK
ncbi:MAG: hypothetical protein IH840_13940 [Candidatus Heimdallarchaeota archaeon]|nr:hypothetical protein [Candidatus Heimdallarchaeota archaeon]